jgi:hypothetical protein
LSAAVVWGVAIAVITEGLSVLGLLSFWWVLAAWLVFVAVVAMNRLPDGLVARDERPPGDSVVTGWRFALAGVVVIVSALGVIAVAAPPNTWDSMTYHMARVAHWMQNGSLAHFPTHIGRQLYLPPWAEFAIMQPQILSGGDRLANLIQWLAMLGSLLGVSLITQQLGGNARCQILAVVVCATIPMGILQASGTQNDYVGSFWLVCFVYFARAFARHQDSVSDVAAAWWVGAGLGLAILSKATGYIVAVPFLMWLTLDGAWYRGKQLWRAITIIALAVLILNAGYYWRNIQVYGSPLGPGREGAAVFANETFGPSAFVSNVVRNIALHIGTPDERVNGALERGIGWLHGRLGADVNDARTTYRDTAFHVVRPGAHEDITGNFMHSALIATSCAMLLTIRALRRRPDLLVYAGALIAASLLFAVYLKWQPWHSRLHLPLFVLWSPFIAVIWGRYRWIAGILVVVLLFMCVPWLVYNESRPLLGADSVIVTSRTGQYFRNRMDLRGPYTAAMGRLRDAGCSKVGLWIDEDAWEYPVWVLAGQEGGGAQGRIEHIHVKNETLRSRAQAKYSFDPCAILLIVAHPTIPATLPFQESVYRMAFRAPPVNLFLRE